MSWAPFAERMKRAARYHASPESRLASVNRKRLARGSVPYVSAADIGTTASPGRPRKVQSA